MPEPTSGLTSSPEPPTHVRVSRSDLVTLLDTFWSQENWNEGEAAASRLREQMIADLNAPASVQSPTQPRGAK